MTVLDAARLLFPALIAFAAASDLLTMTISNRVVMILVGLFAAFAVITGMPMAIVGWHVAAALLVLVVAFGCFAAGWIGGGDAKLASAIALWLGYDQLFSYLIYAALFGGALTLLILQFRHFPLPVVLTRYSWLVRLHDKAEGVPYGIALAAAALMVYPDTFWMHPVAG